LLSKPYREYRQAHRLAVIPAILSLTALIGCGFEPLNAKRSNTSSTVEQMSDVKIAPIQGNIDNEYIATGREDVARLGQQMRNALLNTFNPDGAPANPHYELSVSLKLAQTLAAQDPSGLAQTYYVTVTAKYSLITIADRKSVLSGTSAFTNSYGVVENSYSSLTAKQDAERRAMRGIADDIARRTALYFKRQPAAAN
jgi:hypothetical protein